MPPKGSSPHQRQRKSDEEETGFEVDLLDTSAEGGGITHITFCGKKAIAFNNIVNLRLLLGGTQFYLVERITQSSALADSVATVSPEVGSEWFQLCACDADLPVGAFRVREGGEYWVAHGNLVEEADEEPAATLAELLAHTVDDPQDPHAEKEEAEVEKAHTAGRKRESLPHKKSTTNSTSPLVTALTDEMAQAAEATLSSKKARSSRAKVVPSQDKEVSDTSEPVAAVAPVAADTKARALEASTGKRKRSRKETPEAQLDPLLVPETVARREDSTSPRHTGSSTSGVESPAARVAPRAGSDPQRTAAATLSASRLLSTGATDVVAEEHQQHAREEGARQFAPITLGTPPSSPVPDALKKKPQGSSSPPRTQAAPAEHVEVAPPSLDTTHKKSRKDKHRKRDREETPAPLSEPPANEIVAVAEGRNHDEDADEDEEGADERRRRKKEKKEKKERKKREREEEALRAEATGSDAAEAGDSEQRTKDQLAEKKHKKDKKEKKHKKDKKDKISKSDKKEKKHKKSRTTPSNSPARTSVSPSGIENPSLPPPPPQQQPPQQPQRKDSPALNPPPAMESPAISPSRARKHNSLSTTPRVSPTALNARSPANIPQRSPEPVYSNAPTPPPQALPSPGLVLAPSPPLASPALGFTPVVNSLAEEFSLDNHSLSSFSTDSEYLYE